MADDDIKNVKIVGVDPSKTPKWALEDTLVQVLSANRANIKLLSKMVDTSKVSEADLKKILKEIGESTEIAKDNGEAAEKQTSANQGIWRSGFNKVVSAFQEGGQADKIQAALESFTKTLSIGSTAFKTDINDTFARLGDGIQRTSKEFERTNPILSKTGMIVGLTVEAFTQLVKLLHQQYETQIQLYNSGILVENGFAGLAEAAKGAGLSAEEFTEIVTKHSAVVVGMGIKNTTALMKNLKETTKDFSEFAMSNKQANEAVMDTLDTMQHFGLLTSMDEERRNQFVKEYIVQLNDLSEQTGKQRDEIRKQVAEYSKTSTAFLTMQMLPKEVRKNFQSITAEAVASFGPQGNKLMDEIGKYMAGGVGMMNKEYQLLFTQLGKGSGKILQDMAEATRRGDVEGFKKAKEDLIKNFGEMTPEQSTQLMLMARSNPALAQLVTDLTQASMAQRDREASLDKAAKEEQMRRQLSGKGETDLAKIRKEIAEKEQKSRDALKAQTEAFNQSRDATLALQTEFNKLIAEISPILIPALKALSAVTNYIVDLFRGLKQGIQRVYEMFGMSTENAGTASALTLVTGILAGGTIIKVVLAIVKALAGSAFMGLLGLIRKVTNFGKSPLDRAPAEPPGLGGRKGSGFFRSMSQTIKDGGGAIKDAVKSFGGILNAAAGSFMELLNTIAGGVKNLFVKIGESLGALGKGIGKGVGATLEGVLTGIAAGLKALSNPKLFIGAAVLGVLSAEVWILSKALQGFMTIDWEAIAKAGVAIGALGVVAAAAGAGPVPGFIIAGGLALGVAIGVIGLAVAGASWIMGKALPTLAEGLEKFANIDGKNLIDVGLGMVGIGAGLAAMTAGALVNKYGSLVDGLFGLFSADPMERLKKFAEIDLKKPADSIQALKLALEGFTSDSFKGLKEFLETFSSRDLITRLQDVIRTSRNLNEVAANFAKFRDAEIDLKKPADSIQALKLALEGFTSDSFKGLKEFLETFSSRDLITRLQDVIRISRNLNEVAANFAKFRDSVAPALSPSTSPVNTGGTAAPVTPPVITADQLNVKTLKYYEDSVNKMKEMIDKLETLHTDLDTLTSRSDLAYSRLIDAVQKSGQNVR